MQGESNSKSIIQLHSQFSSIDKNKIDSFYHNFSVQIPNKDEDENSNSISDQKTPYRRTRRERQKGFI